MKRSGPVSQYLRAFSRLAVSHSSVQVPTGSGDRPAAARRGCFGCLFSGGAGCLAFALGSVLAALLFAPSLLGGAAARFLEGALGQDLFGRLELERVNLAWNEYQEIEGLRLYDNAGVQVMAGRVILPGILHWDADDAPLPVRMELSDLLVHRDTTGTSGLALALGTENGAWPGEELDLEFGEFRSERKLDQEFPYDLEIDIDQIRFLDDRRPDFLLRLHSVRARLLRRRGGRVEVRVTGLANLDGVEGPFEVEWEREPGELGLGRILANRIPSGALAELDEGLCHLPLLCGARLELQAELGLDPSGGQRLSGSVQGDGGGAVFDLAWDGDSLGLDGGGRLELNSSQAGNWIERAGLASAGIRSVGPDSSWSAKATELDWSVGWLTDADDDPARTMDFEGSLGEPLLFGDSDLTAGSDSAAPGEPPSSAGLTWSEVQLRLDQDTGGRRVFTAEGRCGEGELRLRIEGPAGDCLSLCGDRDSYELSGSGLSGVELDGWLGAGGLIDELSTGPMTIVLSGPAGDLQSGTHVLHLSGGILKLPPLGIREGVVSMTTPDEQWAVLPMGPQVCSGILQPALPLLHRVEPVGPLLQVRAKELKFRVDGGRLRYRSGELELAPGELKVALHPGFAALFEAEPSPDPEPMALLPIRLRIEGDTLRYLDLDLPLAEEDCDLSGGMVQLDSARLDFDIRATLQVAAHQLQLPESARVLIAESDYIVEMQIVGPLTGPDLKFSAGALAEFMNGGVRSVLKDMPLPMLQSGMERLLYGTSDR